MLCTQTYVFDQLGVNSSSFLDPLTGMKVARAVGSTGENAAHRRNGASDGTRM